MGEYTGAANQFQQFKTAFSKNDFQACTRMLSGLKIALTTLPSLPPSNQQSATSQQELLLARDVLEHAVLVSVQIEDETMFERNFMQLKTFYTDTRDRIPPSDNEQLIIALNLMRLLIQNRIAEFHTELELLTSESHGNAYIKHVTELERYLMEGAYHKVLAARSTVPADSFSYFMESLTSTVRDEIASCSEKAYSHLLVSDAKSMMLFASEKEVLDYAEKRGWEVKDGSLVFSDGSREAVSKELPSLELINYTLTYAKELERIV